MTKFGRRLKRKHPAPAHAHVIGTSDRDMLMAGKSFLDLDDDADSEAQDSVLAIIDLRDTVGQSWFGAHLEVSSLAELRAMVDAIVTAPDGTQNPYPFTVFWAPRSEELLWLLGELGFQVPPDWHEPLRSPPASGRIWTLLKRHGRGLLMQLDFSDIPSLGVPALRGALAVHAEP